MGPAGDVAKNVTPVISVSAKRTIMDYIAVGKSEGRLVAGGGEGPADGHFIQPTVFADIDSKARVFQEEIFGPVLAEATARGFVDALAMANDSTSGHTV